jgi:hypothetical protein
MPATRTTKSGSDADATTTVIARLRNQLANAGIIDHPSVRRELRKLDELLLSQFDQAGHTPGRHRSPIGAAESQPA